MIEIKISIDAAINLLIERMNYEFKLRVKNNILPTSYRLEDLDYPELAALAETAAIDLVFLLPVEVFIQESNLEDILVKSFRSLSKVFNRQEFSFYSPRKVASLLKPIRNTLKLIDEEENYKYN